MSALTCWEPRPFAGAGVHEDPEAEKCPGCGKAMAWDAPPDEYEAGEWSCDGAGGCSVFFLLDTTACGWRYFHIDANDNETDLGATFEAAAAKLKEMREGRA